MAAALQDYKRAIIVGTNTTFGKGTVQTMLPLQGGKSAMFPRGYGDVKVTIQKFYRINGGTTQLMGVIPDVILPDIYDGIEQGEKEMDYHMPFDKIPAAKYTLFNNAARTSIIKDAILRTQKNEYFNLIKKRAIDIAKLRKSYTYSLSMDGYKAQQKALKAQEKSFKDYKYKNVIDTVMALKMDIDDVKMEIELGKKMKEWKDQGLKTDDVKFEADNWKLLDGLRITKPDSFDFMIQTLGVFTNQELVHKACDIVIQKLLDVKNDDELQITPAENTMSNCYDITLKNEDYTIGKAIEYMFYAKYFNDTQILTYCGFKKMHPHDSDSLIRLAYKEVVDKAMIKGHLEICIDSLTQILDKIKKTI